MEHIIQQIAQELVEKIISRAYSGEISDIDALTEEVLGDCKASATKVIETILAEMNLQIREDKEMRKERGIVMKEKERPRSLFTKLGMLHFPRDYYYDRHHRKHVCIMDAMTGVTAYEMVMDGYHFEKKLKMLANQFLKKNVHQRIRKALKEDDRKKADRILQSLCSASDEDEMKKVSEFGTYLMGHWEAIRMRVSEELPRSCTKGQVSHILSERFSRDPLGWSREGLGKLSKQRVYLKNNGKITASDFKRKKESESDTETYNEYARRLLSRSCEKKLNWSLFDKREPIFDVASGTQILLHKTSMLHNAIRN